MRLLLTKALRDIQRRPLRTLLTTLGVLLGVAGVVAISYTGRSLADAQRETYANTRQPDITAFAAQLSPTLVDLIGRRDNVVAVDTQAVQITRASTGDRWVNTRLVGVADFTNMRLDAVQLVSGRFPGPGEIAFDASATKLIDVEVGDLVALQPTPASPINYARVSGFVRAPATIDASILNQATAYMPARDVRQILGRRYDNYLLVRVAEPQRASETADQIRAFLDKRGVTSSNFTVRDPNVFTGSRELGTLLLLLEVFSVVGALLSTFLVANTIAAIMVEETRQVGIIKALGGTRWAAMRPYLFFALTIGITGAVLGWVIGLVGGQLLTGYLAGLAGLVLPGFSPALRELVLALLVGIGVTLGAAVLPAALATRQAVAELLAQRGVVADFHRGITQSLTGSLARVGIVATMGLRNLARRPARAWVTLTVVAVAVAAFLGTQAVSRSVTLTVDHLYDLYGADGWIFFNRPVRPEFATTLEQHPDVRQAEPWANATASIGSVRTDVWGMPRNTDIYTPRVIAGTWLRPANPTGAVLTSNLARAIGASVGDVLTLDIGDRSSLVQVLGIVDDESTYLGAATTGKVFLDVADAQRIIGSGGRATVFALTLQSSQPAAVDASLTRLEERFRQYAPVTLAMYQDQASSRRAIDILTVMLNAMVIIVSAVGLAGIVNTLLINLTERRREYGILRAIGATGRHLVRLVMSEALGLTAAGCAVGVAVGYPLARYLVHLTGTQLFGLEFHLGPVTIAATILVALIATAAVSTAPGLLASRIRPIQVLRYE
ncbi:ABC transporter permease [Sphaerobacter sp.]|uniref:ABC transporter permease n=1 Tax=Sphaerobacter sp. TaxID=2099654 RepID=UPI001D90A4CF|nr:ABC transporter permease [Sphaerobacter sp.]MBX5443565.1 ABC transporter permease [Sphaerobacter sp.]